ncbi:MAG: CARDB domain-containing protein [Gemmatimonadota bacterium]|nr:CARDB domain-containing protein [Gemmatimonadota bacterium]
MSASSVGVGAEIDYGAFAVRNQGGVGAGAFDSGLYLSADSTITADDTRLTGFSIDALGAGEEMVRPAGAITIPGEASGGEMFVGVLVDEVDAVRESDESNNARSVPVTVTAADPPAIGLAPTVAVFDAVEGEGDPDDQVITITNEGGGTLSGLAVTIAYGNGAPEGWLTASLSATEAPAVLTLSASVGSVPEGEHMAWLHISADGAGDRVLNPRLVVSPPPSPVIALSERRLLLTAPADGSGPPSQDVQIENSGQATLSGLAVGVTYLDPEEGWLTSLLSDTEAPATLTVGADADGLDPGAYFAQLEVSRRSRMVWPQRPSM